MNRGWTFRSIEKDVVQQAIKFIIVATIGMMINNTVFYFVTASLYLGFKDIYGLIFGTAIATFWNFGANKKWTFK